MTPNQFKLIRETLGFSQLKMGQELQLKGKTPDRTVRGWEDETTPIPGPVSMAAELLLIRAGRVALFEREHGSLNKRGNK